MTNPTLVILHPAGTPPRQMEALVGPVAGFTTLYPHAKANLRWDHLGNADVPALLALGGDFIAGYSSGAFMALRMVRERQYRGAMIVAGGLLRAPAARWEHPCRVLLIHGTEDARVAYGGSEYVLGALDSAIVLRKALGITSAPLHTTYPEAAPDDGCKAYLDDWAGRVGLITVVGGGHVWPGSKLNAPSLGRVCYDVGATYEMQQFFSH